MLGFFRSASPTYATVSTETLPVVDLSPPLGDLYTEAVAVVTVSMGSGNSRTTPVKLYALGGLGEIGLNLMVLECAGHGFVVDCGVMFPEDRLLGNGVYIPDFSELTEKRVPIDAVVLTHAHEDHIGALPYLLRKFEVPVYGTSTTLAFVRRRLEEAGLYAAKQLHAIEPRKRFEIGPFVMEPLRVTHSTPDSIALAIRTPAGIIVHSGDFKIDDAPVDGQKFDTETFAALGNEGVELLLSDSTNVERAGRTGSESSLKPILRELISRTPKRFFLSAFSSHIHRIRQVAEVSREVGRRVVPLGRRMAESVRLGMEIGQLAFAPGTFIEPDEAEFIEPRKLTYLASGSQGEPFSALAKLAIDNHPRVHLENGDMVVLSSRFIPGNERAINSLVNQLYKLGAEVVYDAVAPVHVSGHASRDELADLIALVKPRYFVPIHGEYRHLSRHLALATEAGISERNCFLMEDGDSLTLAGAEAFRSRKAHTGRILMEAGEVEDLALIGERRSLAHDGTVIAVLAVSASSGTIVGGPDIFSRGFVSGNGTSAHLLRGREEVQQRLGAIPRPYHPDDARIKEEVVRTLRHYFIQKVGKRPFIMVHVMEVP
jgi:ribonuclease J